MTRSRWWTLAVVLALPLAGPLSRAATPEGAKGKTHPGGSKLIRKIYGAEDLALGMSKYPGGADALVRVIRHSVQPGSWSEQGGPGTIEYVPRQKALVVCHTHAAHEQVGCVLKALASAYPAHPTTAAPVARAVYTPEPVPPDPLMTRPAPSGHLKQYGHFVLDNVRVNAMGVSCTVKRIRFMYKGDGIDADVAKCALTNGESEKKAELPKTLTDLLEQVQKKALSDLMEKKDKAAPSAKSIEPPTSGLAPCGGTSPSPCGSGSGGCTWGKNPAAPPSQSGSESKKADPKATAVPLPEAL